MPRLVRIVMLQIVAGLGTLFLARPAGVAADPPAAMAPVPLSPVPLCAGDAPGTDAELFMSFSHDGQRLASTTSKGR